jgi:hypothetical protein
MTRRTRTGRVDGRLVRYAAENCNSYRSPEQLAELEASYQAIVLARGSKELGMQLLNLRRNLEMPWTKVLAAIAGCAT